MVPQPSIQTPLSFDDLSDIDRSKLDNLPLVHLPKSKYKDYALTDLVLELSHLFNQDMIKQISIESFFEQKKSEWGIPKSYDLYAS